MIQYPAQGTNSYVCPTKTQISLPICTVLSESLIGNLWVVKGPAFLQAENSASNQTVWMGRLIRIFNVH